MITKSDALIVVDVQNDFCPGGKLAVPGGDEVISVLNRYIREAKSSGAKIVYSRDWHPPGHASFREQGGRWPRHCVRETKGAGFHPDLEVPDEAEVVHKGVSLREDCYSAFDRTGLAEQLRTEHIERVWVGGLAQDVCVCATVLDACKLGFEVHVIVSATRPVDPESGAEALHAMRAAGAILEDQLSQDANQ